VEAVCTASFDTHKLYVLPTQRMYRVTKKVSVHLIFVL